MGNEVPKPALLRIITKREAEMHTWLTREVKRPGGLLLLAFLTIVVGIAIAIAAVRYMPTSIVPRGIRPMYLYVSFGDFFADVARRYILLVLFEEMVFCALPVSLAYATNRWWSTLAILGGSSILFGFYPVHFILPLGMQWSLVFCRMLLLLLYLKTGGWNSNIRWKAFLSVVAAHYATGLGAFFLIIIRQALLE